jgi:hypothetical protein
MNSIPSISYAVVQLWIFQGMLVTTGLEGASGVSIGITLLSVSITVLTLAIYI